MLKPRTIKLTARKYLAGTDITILEGPAPSPEQRMVAQYQEITAAFDTLDHEAFELGQKFLADLSVQDPDNITLQCLVRVNRAAFMEPTPDDCEFLERHGPDQLQYGLDVYLIAMDGWDCAQQPARAANALKESFMTRNVLDQKHLNCLTAKFKEAGLSVDQIGAEMKDFTARCRTRNIQGPGL